ncbi:hypothetical protein [Saccharopolyspora flava]|uniref:Uncharacterized protein n=1 Tax=Saccharopolyspora flava TaxID=95161 RepID=A0A1I6UZM6_9PSEU|nr:hypothetical protein [Saccharopolyspora flava]SFT06836.1 hypothetical protein SAMN05660874_05427 [Saccharopolyspora flava]
MSEELVHDIGLWLLIPSIVLFTVIVTATALGTPSEIRFRRKERQLARLQQAADQCENQVFEIDWFDYREIPKPEILAVLREHGWGYQDDDLGEAGWLLRFVPAEDRDANGKEDAQRRLRADLRDAEMDVRGAYHLDTSQYAPLSYPEIRGIVRAAGLTVATNTRTAVGRTLVLSKPQTTVLSSSDGPFKPKATLPSRDLDRVRERQRVWAKQFNRQVGLAFLHGFIGLFALAAALTSEPADGTGHYLAWALATVALLLFIRAVLKGLDVRRKRWDELGHLLER